jgi:hypothetical protein
VGAIVCPLPRRETYGRNGGVVEWLTSRCDYFISWGRTSDSHWTAGWRDSRICGDVLEKIRIWSLDPTGSSNIRAGKKQVFDAKRAGYIYITTCCYWFVRNRAKNCRMTGYLVVLEGEVFKRKAEGESHVLPWQTSRRVQTSTLPLTNLAQSRPVTSSASF